MPSGGSKGLYADPDEPGQGRLKVLPPSESFSCRLFDAEMLCLLREDRAQLAG
jgi:hypothetical protein